MLKQFAASIDEKFMHVIESVPDAMILSDQEGRIVLVNANVERIFGYSRDELVGKEVEVLMPERFRSRHREHRKTYYADPSIRRMGVGRDQWACDKYGVEFLVEISLSPVEISGNSLVWTAIRDISERKRSIAQLRLMMRHKRISLRGLIDICAWCKRVRDEGVWQRLDMYVESHSEAKFTHGICTDCLRTLDPASHKTGSCGSTRAGRSA
jgi:PAS domain S-box-containing protein